MKSEYGNVSIDNTRATVAFDRVFDAAMATVWDMLTTDDGLERWLAPATVDLRSRRDHGYRLRRRRSRWWSHHRPRTGQLHRIRMAISW